MKLFLIAILVLSSCASKKVIKIEAPVVEQKKITKVETKNYVVRPGELVFISFSDLREGNNGKLLCKGKSIPYYRGQNGLEAFVAETYFSKLKGYHCIFKVGKKEHLVAHIEVKDKSFPSERLRVAKKKIFPPKKALIRIRKEQKFLNKNYRSSPKYPLFVKAFKKPLDSFVTSIYGSKRLYNNKKQSQHLGTDYRAAVGTPIYSANSGKVVVGRDLYYTGNTVTLDHGLSIFTIYGHMSKLNVVEGDYVPKGALIGWAGATGRVTGPHLHWGVKVYGNWIEGDSLVDATSWLGE